MPLVIGIDEAGYGPNLGPLVIGGSLWQVPDGTPDLYPVLHPVFDRPGQTRDAPAEHSPLIIGDSKHLFSSGGSLAGLELPVLALLQHLGRETRAVTDLFHRLADLKPAELQAQPGYDWAGLAVPRDSSPDQIGQSAERIGVQFSETGVQCLRLAATVVFPGRWNQGLEEFGNKASLLSVLSCRLVEKLLRAKPDDSVAGQAVHIYCDKHGGRNHYAAVIQQEITPHFVTVQHESREQSVYAWSDDAGRALEIEFAARGESRLPVALASMVAKLLREFSMVAWNRFWQHQMPDLQPTAGYPQDARRFRRDIAGLQTSLKINNESIWRVR